MQNAENAGLNKRRARLMQHSRNMNLIIVWDYMKLTKKEYEKINNTMRGLNIDKDSRHINHFKFVNESDSHRKEKFKICCELYDRKHPFLVEAFANNRKQHFDIVDLLENEVIEVIIKSDPPRTNIPAKVTKIYGLGGID